MEQSFTDACSAVLSGEPVRGGIGTLSEKALHAILKQYYTSADSRQEVKIGRYIADIASSSRIIEIQTAGFERLRGKLETFLSDCEVTVVYPIAAVKWICWIDPDTGEITKKRKSPRKGAVSDALPELYKIRNFLQNPRLHLCFPLLELTEYRFLNGWSHDKKRGASRMERIPLILCDEITVHSIQEYRRLIPPALPYSFTAKDFEKAARLSPRKSWNALQVLLSLGLIEKTGMQGKAFLYSQHPEAITETGRS